MVECLHNADRWVMVDTHSIKPMHLNKTAARPAAEFDLVTMSHTNRAPDELLVEALTLLGYIVSEAKQRANAEHAATCPG